MANKPNQSEVYSAGESPTCVLHGEQLKHVESKLDDLHKTLYRNGFMKDITTIALDSKMALERIQTNTKLIWAMFSVVLITAMYIIYRHDMLGK